LDTSVEADILKNVVLHSVATALASSVLPVPGGPWSRIPLQGRRIPVNSAGNFNGNWIASASKRLASSRPVMSEKLQRRARAAQA